MACALCGNDSKQYETSNSTKLHRAFVVCHGCATERLRKWSAPASIHYGAVEAEAAQCARDLRDAAVRDARAVRYGVGA